MSLIPKIRNSQSNLINSIYINFFLNKVKTFTTLSAERIDYQSQSTNNASEGAGGGDFQQTTGSGFNTDRGNFNEFVQNNPNRFNQIELHKTPDSLNLQTSYSNLQHSHSGYHPNSLNFQNRENSASNGSFYREQLQNPNRYHQHVMNVNHGQSQQNSLQDSNGFHQQVMSVSFGQFQQNSNEYNKEKNVMGFQQNQNEFQSEMNSVHSQSSMSCVESGSEVKCNGTLEEMDGFCNAGNVEEAMRVLNLLHEQGIEIDLPRYCQLMKVIGEVVAKEEAKSIHNHLMKTKLSLEIRVQNKVLEMYLKCGLMSDAHDLFGKIPARNLTSWDTMVVGLAENGYGEEAIQVFTEFKEAGGRPDGQMFLGVFYACSTLCDTNEGMLHFESMSKVYGITPTMDHYVGVVKMLGSTGNIDEAFEFIENMPVEPSIDVWETLMNLCRIHGNLETGDLCSNIIAPLDPSRLNVESKAGLVPVNPSDQVIAEKKKSLQVRI